ncbi:NADase-type glycan-binding domain-containing protein [Streptomyces purpurascens]|uniref:Zinc ribbon domain-containing protein n=1 Tax=Streptomyces purpurascens TaxID=1924 RepID=A0ABZ1MSU5_STREF|nr:zinc ribbon domain-containing protein [Streptomyces purpurascens]MCE7049251.1 zinc ribbon domain-containing protein [Streptomyces purpurascens]GHA47517.1 zinc ribbon domain-containing protein [Streptomyces purpurascens]
MTTPQNCADCGTRAEPGQSFCDACGAVLSWTDRPASGTGPRAEAARPSQPAPASEPAVPPRSSEHARAANGESGGGGAPSPEPGWDAFARPDGGAGLARTPRDRLGTGTGTATQQASARAAATPEAAPRHPDHHGTPDDHPAGPHTTADPGTTTPESPSPTTPPPDETAPTEPVPPATQTPHPADADADTHGMTDRARSLLIPVGDPEPQPDPHPSVTPVLPGRPEPQRPQAVRAPGQEHGMDGGAPCPWCATRNRPERHFCARCAMPMAGDGPAGPVRLPWWRRLGPFGSQEAPWAGDRPRLRRTFDRVLSWLGIVIVLSLLIVLVINIPQGIQATRDHFAKRAEVSPDRYAASRYFPGHKPDLAFDKLNDTWWGPGVSESGKGQWVEARFDQPTRLLDLIITPGVSIRPDKLRESALPHRVEATITGADGKKTTRQITLDQGAGPQRRAFRVGAVTAVRFTIESAHGISAKKQVAIAEIEFFGPSSANST